AFVTPAVEAAMAVAAGHTDVCMAFRLMMQQPSSAALAAGALLDVPDIDDAQFHWPFGFYSPTQWAALYMNRYLYESATAEEHVAQFAVTQREYAMSNPEALQRTPLTVEDYLAMPYISSPLRLLDCDYPCDSGSAVIFTTEE